MIRSGLSVAALLAFSGGALGGTPNISVVAVAGQQAPGLPTGVIYITGTGSQQSKPPRLNNAGQVAFFSSLSGSGIGASNNTAIFSSAPGSVQLLAREGSPSPGSLRTFTTFREIVLNASGNVAFPAITNGGSGYFLGSPGNLEKVIENGDPITGEPGLTMTSAGIYSSLSDGNHVAGDFRGPGSINCILQGGSSFPVGAVMVGGAQAPGLDPGVQYDSFNSFSRSPAINMFGTTVFESELQGAGVSSFNDESLWYGTPGQVSALARRGDQAPGLAAGIFYGDPQWWTVDSTGTVTFVMGLQGAGTTPFNDGAIYLGPPANPQLVLREGSGMDGGFPAGATYIQFPVAMQNSSGTFAMEGWAAINAGLGIGSGNNEAIYIGTPTDRRFLIREGVQAPGMPTGVAAFGFNQLFLNQRGQLFFTSLLTGPGITSTTQQMMWLAGPNGSIIPAYQSGGTIEVAPGDVRTVSSFRVVGDNDGQISSNGEDGRATCFNNEAQVAFQAYFVEGGWAMCVIDLELPVECAADIDGSGAVDFGDLDAVLGAWGTADPMADIDGSGLVDFPDLNTLLAGWEGVCE